MYYVVYDNDYLKLVLREYNIHCVGCHIANGETLKFRRYSILIDHLVQHIKQGYEVPGHVFFLLNNDMKDFCDKYNVSRHDSDGVYHDYLRAYQAPFMGV